MNKHTEKTVKMNNDELLEKILEIKTNNDELLEKIMGIIKEKLNWISL